MTSAKEYFLGQIEDLNTQNASLEKEKADLTISLSQSQEQAAASEKHNQDLEAELTRRDTARWAAGRLWAAVKNRLGLKGRK